MARVIDKDQGKFHIKNSLRTGSVFLEEEINMSLLSEAKKVMERARADLEIEAEREFLKSVKHYEDMIIQAASYGQDKILLREPELLLQERIRAWAGREGFVVINDEKDRDVLWVSWGE